MKRNPSSLQVDRSDVLCEIPRAHGHVLRLSFGEGITAEGRRVSWFSLAEFFTDPSGTKRPTIKRVTIRAGELAQLGRALLAAASRAA